MEVLDGMVRGRTLCAWKGHPKGDIVVCTPKDLGDLTNCGAMEEYTLSMFQEDEAKKAEEAEVEEDEVVEEEIETKDIVEPQKDKMIQSAPKKKRVKKKIGKKQ